MSNDRSQTLLVRMGNASHVGDLRCGTYSMRSPPRVLRGESGVGWGWGYVAQLPQVIRVAYRRTGWLLIRFRRNFRLKWAARCFCIDILMV